MMANKQKSDAESAKALTQQKRNQRRWLAFVRICRYGISNFRRNAWLSIAATAVMTITLLIIFVSLAARTVLVDTVDQIRDKVDMSIYLKNDTPQKQADKIKDQLNNLSSVRSVTYISPEEARADFVEQNKRDSQTLEALNEAINKFPGILRVNVVDISDPSELNQFVKTNELIKQFIDSNREPSFSGDRRSAIENIARWVSFAEKIGIGASVIFVVISALIIFNTIRMAIFNRKEEIQMMKLIGADRSFIRGPFIIEAVVYGFVAAILATGIGFALLHAAKDTLLNYQIAIQPVIDLITAYLGIILFGMIIVGAIIGIISSLLATRRYLKA
jgi:cell division transport system permease protein